MCRGLVGFKVAEHKRTLKFMSANRFTDAFGQRIRCVATGAHEIYFKIAPTCNQLHIVISPSLRHVGRPRPVLAVERDTSF